MNPYAGLTLARLENQDRRRFLKNSLSLAGASLLSGCSTLDKMILGDTGATDPKQILILGGGLAGLTAAYELKKLNKPFCIFEASPRIGGRILTLHDFNSASQSADLGGEWISPLHDSLIHLAKELDVKLDEMPLLFSETAFFDNGKRVGAKELYKEIQQVQKICLGIRNQIFTRGSYRLSHWNQDELPRAVSQDAQSCEEFFKSPIFKISSAARTLLHRDIEMRWGASAFEVSSLHWIYSTSAGVDFSPFTHKAFRVSGGTGVLPQALMDRVVGVIPGRFIRTQHELIEVSEYSSGFELKFQTPDGIKTIMSSKVLCTLPFSVLRHVKGVQKLSFTEPVQKLITEMKYGDQAKGVLSFTERPWKKSLEVLRFSGDFESQNFWEGEPRSAKDAFTQRSLLAFQLGGKSAKTAGLHSVDQAVKDLTSLKLATGYEGLGQIHNWSEHKWSRGGVSYFAPRQTGNFAGLLSEPQCLGRWYFAGEHTSLQWPSTLNGAVESAQMAVRRATRVTT